MSATPPASGSTVRLSTLKRAATTLLGLLCLVAWLMPMHLLTNSLGVAGAETQPFTVTCAPLWRTGGSPAPSAYDDDDHGGVSAAQQQLAGVKDNPYTSTQMWDEIHRSCDRARQNRQTWLLVLLAATGAAGLGWRPRGRRQPCGASSV